MDKFNTLLENVQGMYQQGSFLTGDLVKFKADALSHDWSKTLARTKMERLREMIDSGENIRVCAVKPAGNAGICRDPTMNTGPWFVDVIRERAPGLYADFLTVPEEILEIMELDGINRPPVPDKFKRKDGSHIKPEVVERAPSDANLEMMKQTRGGQPAKELPNSNTTLPKATHPTPGESYTKRYLDKTGIQPGN